MQPCKIPICDAMFCQLACCSAEPCLSAFAVVVFPPDGCTHILVIKHYIAQNTAALRLLAAFELQIAGPELCIVEGKPEARVADLRMSRPWPQLREFAHSIDLDSCEDMVHKHTPWGAQLL